MPRPRRSTRDEFIDQFDSWDIESQESVLDQLQLIHRLAKRRVGRKSEDAVEAKADAAPLLEGQA